MDIAHNPVKVSEINSKTVASLQQGAPRIARPQPFVHEIGAA
jgi:hypothetical protein